MNHIYVDGSYCNFSKKAGIGIPCFNVSVPIRAKDPLSAEIVAAIRAAVLAKDFDILVSDCKTLVDAVNLRRTLRRHRDICRNLLKLIETKRLSMRWVSREDNKKANLLAKRGRKSCSYMDRLLGVKK